MDGIRKNATSVINQIGVDTQNEVVKEEKICVTTVPYGQMIPSKEKKMFTNISLDDYWFNGSFRRRKLEVQGLQ
jgi:hypothetical protein